MAEPVEGIWKCTVLGGEANADDKDIVHCRINVQIDEGPDKGRRVTYDEQVNNKSARYVVMSARAVGWRGQGRLEDTFHSDVDAWIKATGGVSTVEIQHIKRKTGKQAGTFWGKARSIGRRQSLLKPPSQSASDDANDAIQAALAAAQETNGGGGGYDDAPPPSDDDIPFISCSTAAEYRGIAKVLR